MTWSRIHSAPLRVLPKPRPASSSQVRQSPFGACWLGRPHQPQSCSIASSSRFQIFVDLPQRRLRMVADPRRGATLAHHVPARLVLAVVMAAADREVVFGPNDLRAGLEAAGG